MKNDKDTKALFSNTVFLYVMKVSTYIFPLITFPYLTRVLGAANYGVITFSNAIMVYFQLIVDFGFIISSTRDCSIHRDNKSKLGHILSSTLQAKVLVSIIGFFILIFLCLFDNTFKVNKTYIMLSYLSVWLNVFVPDYLFRGIEKMGSIAYRTIFSRLIYTVLVLAFIKTQNDYILIPIFTAVSDLFIVVWSWYFIFKKLEIRLKIASIKDTIDTLKSSSIFFLSRAASSIYTASNAFILGYVISGPLMGSFGSANSLITNLRGMFGPVSDSIYPYMVRKKNFKLIKLIILISSPIIIAGTAFLFINAEWIIRIFCGNDTGFSAAVPIFRAMLPMIVITLPIYLLGYPTLGAMNMMKEANITVMFAAVYHIIGLFVLHLFGALRPVPVSLLTCTSELVVLISRIIYVYIGWREHRLEQYNS